jgi:ATP-dependent Clp protease ATP-binding subunit ClpX
MGRNRNANCSFCRKNYRDVGPLVEGPGDVYICGECIELCQSIIDQEKQRRGQSAPEAVRARFAQLVPVGQESCELLFQAAINHFTRCDGGQPGPVLLLGPTRSSKVFLVRALAHALKAPFVQGDAASLVRTRIGKLEIEPFLYNLLLTSDFNVERVQHGVVYIDGADRRDVQEALLQLWEGEPTRAYGPNQIDVTRPLVLCGGEFAGLDAIVARLGRHPEQPITEDALLAFGVVPALVRRLGGFVKVPPLDEESLGWVVPWIDFARMMGESASS